MQKCADCDRAPSLESQLSAASGKGRLTLRRVQKQSGSRCPIRGETGAKSIPIDRKSAVKIDAARYYLDRTSGWFSDPCARRLIRRLRKYNIPCFFRQHHKAIGNLHKPLFNPLYPAIDESILWPDSGFGVLFGKNPRISNNSFGFRREKTRASAPIRAGTWTLARSMSTCFRPIMPRTKKACPETRHTQLRSRKAVCGIEDNATQYHHRPFVFFSPRSSRSSTPCQSPAQM